MTIEHELNASGPKAVTSRVLDKLAQRLLFDNVHINDPYSNMRDSAIRNTGVPLHG